MASLTADFAQGTAAWLIGTLERLIPALNADLAAKVTGMAPPAFEARPGDYATAGVCRLTAGYVGERPRRQAKDRKAVTLTFRISCLIPFAGDDGPANFEMCRQVARDHVLTVFDDDTLVLTPTIDAGLIGVVRAQEGERGPVVDIFPRLMADRVTVVRGWEMQYACTFSLKTR